MARPGHPARLGIVNAPAAALVLVVVLAACDSQQASVSTEAPSRTPGLPGTRTLAVQVLSGGDCIGIQDRFVVGSSKPGATPTLVATRPADPASVRVVERGGLIPCTYEFRVPDLPEWPRYFVHDLTADRGWGPWSFEQLQTSGWQVTVEMSDLD